MSQGSNGDLTNTDKAISRVTLEFEPRGQLQNFINDKNTVYWLENQPGHNPLSENIVIKGDNLSAMAALRVSWLLTEKEGKFDVIYIDPPYNVGGNTSYKNKWKGESEGNFGWAGDHGKFLDFMEPRLKMAKLLMKDEGIIFISICDAEYPRLLMLMNEIFGEPNAVGTFVWDKKQGSPSDSINVLHEYIICFAKNKKKAWKLEQLKPGCEAILKNTQHLVERYGYEEACVRLKKWTEEQVKKDVLTRGEASYCLIHPKTYRVFASNPTCAQDDISGTRCRIALKHPITGKKCPVPAKGWKWSEENLLSMVDYDEVIKFGKGYISGKILFGPDHTTVPRKAAYLDEMTKQKPPSIIRVKSSGVGDLPSGVVFDTPKPVELLEILLGFIPSKEIQVLDFFAGGGTTAHAVCNLNKSDKGIRTYVLIEEMERTINEAIIPRIEYLTESDSFGLYHIIKKQAGSIDLLKAFRKHAEEFVGFLHSVDQDFDLQIEGMRIIGYSSQTDTLVATLSQELRNKDSLYFRAELSCLAKAITQYKATKVVVYKLESEFNGKEEPWAGIKSDIFIGTTCKRFNFISLPSAIVKAWKDTLIALEAV
ncbi:MAG: site-specific DNA-methyltransferase [Eubacteriales bacterium]|jgi:DNA modification methylase